MSTVQGTTGQDIGQQLNKVLQAQAAAAGGANAAGAEKVTADGTEDRFLKLLVAQMRNQDPLNPMDNATDGAQISTVRGIESLNDSMSALVANLGRGSPLEALGLIGRQVLAARRSSGCPTPTARRGGRLRAPGRRGCGAGAGGRCRRQRRALARLGQDPRGHADLRVGRPHVPGNAGPGRHLPAARGGRHRRPAQRGHRTCAVLGVTPGTDGVRIELSGQRSIAADAIKAIL